jgi:hypothetical protein
MADLPLVHIRVVPRSEKRADANGEVVLRIWLSDEMNARIQSPMMYDSILGIAGGEQYRKVRSHLQDLIAEVPTAFSPGQDDVSEDKVDWNAALHDFEGFVRVMCLLNCVAKIR